MRHPRAHGQGPGSLLGALLPATWDLKLARLPERPNLTVRVDVRDWGLDGGPEGWRAKVHSPPATNLPGALSFPRGGGGQGAA